MKKILGIIAVTILGATLGFSQTNTGGTTPDQANTPSTTSRNDTDRNDHNWGWLGLLGLGGLAGLGGRRRIDEADRKRTSINEVRKAA